MSSSAVAVDCSLEAAPAPQTRPTRVFLYPHDTSLASNYGQQEVDAFNQLFASDAPKTDKVAQGSDGNADKSSMTRLWLASDVYDMDNTSDCNRNIVENLRRMLQRDWLHSNSRAGVVVTSSAYTASTRQEVEKVVTIAYLRDCVATGQLLPTILRIHYSPILIRSRTKINHLDTISIASTGYRDALRDSLQRLANDILKVQWTTKLSMKETHMLTYDFKGKKFDTVNQWKSKGMAGVKMVNHLWLEDSIRSWKVLPTEPYCELSGRQVEEILMLNASTNMKNHIPRAIDTIYEEDGMKTSFDDVEKSCEASIEDVQIEAQERHEVDNAPQIYTKEKHGTSRRESIQGTIVSPSFRTTNSPGNNDGEDVNERLKRTFDIDPISAHGREQNEKENMGRTSNLGEEDLNEKELSTKRKREPTTQRLSAKKKHHAFIEEEEEEEEEAQKTMGTKTYSILLSGMHKDERTRYSNIINRKIKEQVSTSEKEKSSIKLLIDDDSFATHVVFQFPLRGLKFLLGCVHGSWLLSSTWLTESSSSRIKTFADEEAHELTGNESGTISSDCARYWRMKASSCKDSVKTPSHVFSGLRVCFFGKIEDKKMLSILFQQGGAVIVPVSAFLREMNKADDSGDDIVNNEDATSGSVDVVVVPEDKSAQDPAVKKLSGFLQIENMKANFIVVLQEFFVDWIAKPNASLRQHIILTKSRKNCTTEHENCIVGENLNVPHRLIEIARKCRGAEI